MTDSLRSLVAQWRQNAGQVNYLLVMGGDMLRACASELETALNALPQPKSERGESGRDHDTPQGADEHGPPGASKDSPQPSPRVDNLGRPYPCARKYPCVLPEGHDGDCVGALSEPPPQDPQ